MTVRDGSERLQARLAEVDAPERTQPYRQVSRKKLDSLCRNRPVEIEKVDVDRCGCTATHVYGDGIRLNWRQVEDGMA